MPELSKSDVDLLLADMSANVTDHAIKIRKAAAHKWAEFRGEPGLSESEVVMRLMALTRPQAIVECKQFTAWLEHAVASPKTVRMRVTSLAHYWRRANDLGFASFLIPKLSYGKPLPVRDMRGPSWADIERMFAVNDPKVLEHARASCLLALFALVQLRLNEVHTLFVEHWDPVAQGFKVAGKGTRGARQTVQIPDRAAKCLLDWLEHRGAHHGRLFECHKNNLTAIVKSNASRAGLTNLARVSPHRLRHSGLTRLNAVAAEMGMTVADVAAAARHADPRTTMRYLDNPEERALALRNAMSSPGGHPAKVHPLKPNLYKLV